MKNVLWSVAGVFALIAVLTAMPSVKAVAAVPGGLVIEYLENPENIDTQEPRFSWAMKSGERGDYQTAYQVIVATSAEKLANDIGDMWDTGKIMADKSANVVYQGTPLRSGAAYYWKVRVWDKDGVAGAYSAPACFSMGLLSEQDWKGQWIGNQLPKARVEREERGAWGTQIAGGGGLLRKEFTLRKAVARARVYVSGIGYYELHINGEKIGNHVLDPLRTNYDVRVFYSAFDVTNVLREGSNAAGIMLGQGWYLSTPRAIMQLNVEYADGTTESVATDNTWKQASGPITENSIYHGETYDARLEEAGWDMPDFNDADWKPVILPGGPGGKLTAQAATPIKITSTIQPKSLSQPKKGVWVYDMGQNLTGWVQLAVQGPKGTTVRLEFSELLYPEGMINDENLRSARAIDTYILKGEGLEIWEPRFTYHGFRYVQVTGMPYDPDMNTIRCRVVHSAVNEDWKSSFACSNDLFNWIQHAIQWGQLTNLHGYPSDCPQRDERQGWAADGHVTAEEAIYNFNMASTYTKWVDDIFSNQEEDGLIPDISPTETKKGVRNDDAGWDSYCVLMPWYMYLYFDDTRILTRHYDGMKKYVDHLTSKAENGIINFGTYSDWIAPERTPIEVSNTGYYYYCAHLVSKIADVLGYSQDASRYASLAEEIANAFNREFFDGRTGTYKSETAFSYVWPLFLDIVPGRGERRVVANLIRHITETWDGHISTGTLGTKYIYDVLVENGYSDLAYEMTAKETYPGWGYMRANGATTLWELWENRTGTRMNSHNHIMLGSVGEWFYKHLAGIQMIPETPGFRKFAIKPIVPGNLTSVKAKTETIRGMISSAWERSGDSITLTVSIPANSEATVCVPTLGMQDVTVCEGGTVLSKNGAEEGSVPGITFAGMEPGYVKFTAGSGNYTFSLTGTSYWDR